MVVSLSIGDESVAPPILRVHRDAALGVDTLRSFAPGFSP